MMGISIESRLQLSKYSDTDCRAAMRGEAIPLNLGCDITQLCVIRGIRYHPGFGTELLRCPRIPEFARALNARSMMSNIIPDMIAPEEFPYCIWHPEVATEETYRALSIKYRQMRYNIGRACAVGGYYNLYLELQLLPEVSIAEEARENRTNGAAIFEDIMKQPVKYAVMNDYERSVKLNNPRTRACLNGDTAVLFLLEVKQELMESMKTGGDEEPLWGYFEYTGKFYFNITEDCNIDEYQSKPLDYTDVVPLLYSPLPPDLSTVKKDILILMAAYYGDIDRYTRLRRPTFIDQEAECVIHGIYHNSMFAKWWALETVGSDSDCIELAITARFIMNNDLSRVIEMEDEDEDKYEDCAEDRFGDQIPWDPNQVPYQIWYPTCAHYSTYEELARRRPSMKYQAARACIVGDYQDSYDRIQAKPNCYLMYEAKASPNPYYLKDLKRRAAEMKIDLETQRLAYNWKEYITHSRQPKNQEMKVPQKITLGSLKDEAIFWYDGLGLDISSIELFACIPEDMRPTNEFPRMHLDIKYLQACRPLAEDHHRAEYPRGRGSRNARGIGARGRVRMGGLGRGL